MMPVPVPLASHDKKIMLNTHFDYLDIRNAMVPLATLSMSHDASANGVSRKVHARLYSFLSFWPNAYSGAIDDAVML